MVAATMILFGLGAGLPLALLGSLTRKTLMAWRDRLIVGGKGAKAVFGLILVVLGLLIVSGRDKSVETALVAASPQWLTTLTTSY
jgi:sulfite exporter TauE/SafE